MPALPWDKEISKELDTIRSQTRAQLDCISRPVLLLCAFSVGSLTTICGAFAYTRYLRRIPNSDWITPDIFAKKRWVRGTVTSVGDSDNFRLYHTPAFGWSWPFKFRTVPSTAKGLKDKTLHIRIAGVDAPEGAHFGRPSQPFFEESLAWLRHAVLGRTVYCQLLRRDQYSRVVALVVIPPRLLAGSRLLGKSLSLEMLKAGWVTTYEQAGAEYGKWGKEEFLRVEAEARAARRGMWVNGIPAESPAEYKRRFAAKDRETAKTDSGPSETPAASAAKSKRWLFKWL